MNDACIGHAGGIGIAFKFDIATQRNGAKLPACAFSVYKAPQLRSEADGEGIDLHATPAAHQKVSHFMHKNDDNQCTKIGNCCQTAKMNKSLHHIPANNIPLNWGCSLVIS